MPSFSPLVLNFLLQSSVAAASPGSPNLDAAFVASVVEARTRFQSAPSDWSFLLPWAGAMSSCVDNGTFARGKVPASEIDAFLVAVEATKSRDAQLGPVFGWAAKVAVAAGRKESALAISERGLEVNPTSDALLAWLVVVPDLKPASAQCARTRSLVFMDVYRFDLLYACNAVVGLDWASAEDRSWLASETARRQAAADAHLADLASRYPPRTKR